jgi:prephenate dehydrogenase
MSTWRARGDCGMTSPSSTPPPAGRAQVVGLGLVGGSIGLALRGAGWHVTGQDLDAGRRERAHAMGAVDAAGDDPTADLAFVATPASSVAAVAAGLLDAGSASLVVTDVAGVKRQIVQDVASSRFVGGHPMAGSEQEGLDGADAALFHRATWVLTPSDTTDPAAFARVRTAVSAFGAEVVALPPERHDALVAMVSHVPHLTAATLMSLAADTSDEHAALLRLAAGGFRDMTRIAAGHPGIWPDICAENAVAIVEALDALLERLGEMRTIVTERDRDRLVGVLERARNARRALVPAWPRPEASVELRVPVTDRPGVLAEVTTIAGELGVNIEDLEIAHSGEGPYGVLVLALPADGAARVAAALQARGHHPAVRSLE